MPLYHKNALGKQNLCYWTGWELAIRFQEISWMGKLNKMVMG
jgi:hypothetical protein